MASVHPIGKPENNSERKAIAYFRDNLPDEYHIFHNLELPTHWGLPYEYDLIIVGEYAVYSVEVKGYQGEIKGNAQEWELESGAIIKSPIPLANKKAKIVADRLRRYSLSLDNVWVQSLIVLTDDKVRIKVNDEQATIGERANRVLHLDEAVIYMGNPNSLPISPTAITGYTTQICDALSHQFRARQGKKKIGDFEVEQVINQNQLYTTLLGRHTLIDTRRRFTLKMYSFNVYSKPETRKKHERWMFRDVNALLWMESHPNIVQTFLPFPWEHNKYVLPVAWVDGYSLRGLLDGRTQLDLARKIEIVRQICKGLHHCHQHGVIHRDLRPDNIIVPHTGPIKLVNFDCARMEGSNMQTIATRIGRHLDERYIAPEVWPNVSAASPASDIYAAGIILFELLTGEPPYQKIRDLSANKGLPRLPTEVNSQLPSDVDQMISLMCAFKPEERISNIDEVLEYLNSMML